MRFGIDDRQAHGHLSSASRRGDKTLLMQQNGQMEHWSGFSRRRRVPRRAAESGPRMSENAASARLFWAMLQFNHA